MQILHIVLWVSAAAVVLAMTLDGTFREVTQLLRAVLDRLGRVGRRTQPHGWLDSPDRPHRRCFTGAAHATCPSGAAHGRGRLGCTQALGQWEDHRPGQPGT